MRGPFVAFVVLSAIGVLALASRWMTQYECYGRVQSGSRIIHVTDEYGNPVGGAMIDILANGEIASRSPFTEYKGPNSLVSNERGDVRLKNLGFGRGGSGWKLFWIWDIRNYEIFEWQIRVSHPAFCTQTIGSEQVFSADSVMNVVLAHN